MKNGRIVFFVAVVLFLCACPASALIQFKDGLTHDIDYEIYDDVWVDWRTPDMFTTVNLLPRGSIEHPAIFEGYEDSRINIHGGYIFELYARGSSKVNVYGGLIDGVFETTNSSQVNISGGSIYGLLSSASSRINISGGSILHFSCYDSSQVNISGGSIGDDLILQDQSMLQILGYDFAVDGQPFGYGELTSIYGGWPEDEPLRHLTGTLLSGELFDNDFYIGHDARIVLMPEPTTLLLLGLGGLTLLRNRRFR